MAISSISQVDGAGGVEVDEVPPEPVPTPISSGPAAEVSSFEAAPTKPIELNPQAPLPVPDGSKRVTAKGRPIVSLQGTNDDSIGDGLAGAVRPVLTAARPEGSINGEPLTAGLTATGKMQVAALLADPATATDASYALGSTTFSELPADQREKFVDIMANGGTTVAEMLAMACEHGIDFSVPRANDGSTALDNVDLMIKRPDLAASATALLADVVNPDRIWQGKASTCTAATMQYEMASKNPAEYSRLLTGLFTNGSVTMAGRGMLEVQSGAAISASMAAKDARSPTEAVFQAALMEFANGDEQYDVVSGQSTGGSQAHPGLKGDQIRTALTHLFNISYLTVNISNDDEAAVALADLRRSPSPNQPVLVDLTVDGKTTNHCVAFEGIINGKVQLRDPQTGKHTSISQQQFIQHAATIHTPQPMRIAPPQRRHPIVQVAQE